jgi:GNAT superfamily N-acetyltransferase
MIRPARPDDVATIVALIKELAAYEREPDAVQACEADLRSALFCDEPAVFALIAEHDGAGTDSAPQVAGFALWFLSFSTWVGKHGIYLEDLYVRPQLRGHGYGKALLTALTAIAHERSYGRVEWAVLDWNESAQQFYRSLGAKPMDDWTIWRLGGADLTRLGTRVGGHDGGTVTTSVSPPVTTSASPP